MKREERRLPRYRERGMEKILGCLHGALGTFDMSAGKWTSRDETTRDRNRNKKVRTTIHLLISFSLHQSGEQKERNVGVSSMTMNGSHGRVRGSPGWCLLDEPWRTNGGGAIMQGPKMMPCMSPDDKNRPGCHPPPFVLFIYYYYYYYYLQLPLRG